MSHPDQPKPFNSNNVTASVSGVLIGLVALVPTESLSTEAKGILAMLIGIISPYVAAIFVRWHRKLDIDPGLMDLKNRLESDLETQNKLLATPDLSEETKAAVIKKRETTMLRLASLNQDFNDGTITLRNRED